MGTFFVFQDTDKDGAIDVILPAVDAETWRTNGFLKPSEVIRVLQ